MINTIEAKHFGKGNVLGDNRGQALGETSEWARPTFPTLPILEGRALPRLGIDEAQATIESQANRIANDATTIAYQAKRIGELERDVVVHVRARDDARADREDFLRVLHVTRTVLLPSALKVGIHQSDPDDVSTDDLARAVALGYELASDERRDLLNEKQERLARSRAGQAKRRKQRR